MWKRLFKKGSLFWKTKQSQQYIITIEDRVFNRLCDMAIGLSVFVTLFNMLIGLDFWAIVSTAVGGIVIYVLKFVYNRTRHKLLAKGTILSMLYLLFSYLWFVNDGINGSIVYCFFVMVVISLAFLERNKWRALVINILFFAVLTFIQAYWPNIVSSPYDSKVDKILDIVVTYIMTVFVAYSVMYIFVREYNIERRRVEEQNQQLLIANKQLEEMATKDYLTGILNRRKFIALSEIALKEEPQKGNSYVLYMIDLDLFKKINDQFGHHIGDLVLKKFVEIVQNNISSNTLFGRMGGEEFAVLLLQTDTLEAMKKAEIIRNQCQNAVLYEEGNIIQFSVSIGVSVYQFGNSLEQLMIYADKALYQAKEKGRNCIKRLDY